MKIVYVPDSYVVREIFPSGEWAWRVSADGQWAYSPDHKDEWVSVPYVGVPQRVIETLLTHFDIMADDLTRLIDIGMGLRPRSEAKFETFEISDSMPMQQVLEFTRTLALRCRTFVRAIHANLLMLDPTEGSA